MFCVAKFKGKIVRGDVADQDGDRYLLSVLCIDAANPGDVTGWYWDEFSQKILFNDPEVDPSDQIQWERKLIYATKNEFKIFETKEQQETYWQKLMNLK